MSILWIVILTMHWLGGSLLNRYIDLMEESQPTPPANPGWWPVVVWLMCMLWPVVVLVAASIDLLIDPLRQLWRRMRR